jgi:hypothetical protein
MKFPTTELSLCRQMGTFSGLCYYFSNKGKTTTWEEAKKVCKTMKKTSTLVMPKTQKKNNFLNNRTEESAVHPDIWIGGFDIEEEGIWKWVVGKKILRLFKTIIGPSASLIMLMEGHNID